MKLNSVFTKIVEALSPSQYRPVVKNWDRNRYSELFDTGKHPTDKKKFRMYIPILPEKPNVKPIPEVEAAVKAAGYEIVDYIAGLAANNDGKRVMKIGKILSKDQGLMQKFANDPQREASKTPDHLVVISRHPYDIAGMSTDRGWTSCMNLKNGINRHYVPIDVKEGTLIAYVIKSDDKNINRPVGRILIKPFINEVYPKEVALGAESKVYGTDVPGFRKIVVEWCNQVNDSRNLGGVFQLNSKLYNDGGAMKKRLIGKNISIEDKIRFDPKEIEGIRDPSEDLQMIAVSTDAMSIQYIKNPTKKVILAAIKSGTYVLDAMKKAGVKIPEDIIDDAFKVNPMYIKYYANPSLEMCQDAYTRARGTNDGYHILYVLTKTNVPEEFWWWALRLDPHVMNFMSAADADKLHNFLIDHHIKAEKATWDRAWYIKKPSRKTIDRLIQIAGHGILGALNYTDNNVKISKKEGDAAVKADPSAIARIPTKWVSKDVQLDAVTKDPKMIQWVSKDVKIKAIEQVPQAIEFVITGNDMTGKMSAIAHELCTIALKKDPTVIQFIDMPTEEMVQTAVDHDPLLMFKSKTKYWPIKAMAKVIHDHPEKRNQIENALKISRMHSRKWKAVEEALRTMMKSSGDFHVKKHDEHMAVIAPYDRAMKWRVEKVYQTDAGVDTVEIYNIHAGEKRISMSDFREGIKKANSK